MFVCVLDTISQSDRSTLNHNPVIYVVGNPVRYSTWSAEEREKSEDKAPNESIMKTENMCGRQRQQKEREKNEKSKYQKGYTLVIDRMQRRAWNP